MSASNREVKKNETKAQPMLPERNFEKPAVLTKITKLPNEVVESFISPLFSLEDKSNLMITSVGHHQFFKDSAIERLSHHVAYGEFKNAEIMAKGNPQLLLQTATIKVAHTGLELKMTPLQAAIYFKDQEMIAMFQKYMAPKEIEKQMKAQFPEGYEAYKETEQKRISEEGFKILEDTFAAILEAKVTADDQNNLTLDEKAESAINGLRNYLKREGAIETGQDITDLLLLKAFKLYDAYFDRFSTENPRLTDFSPKNMLAWRRIVGLCQFNLPLNYIQALCNGLHNATANIENREPQGRALTFEIENDNSWIQSPFRAMVSNSSSGLGFDYAVSSGGGRAQVVRVTSRFELVWMKWLCSPYFQSKNSEITELMRPRAHPQSVKVAL